MKADGVRINFSSPGSTRTRRLNVRPGQLVAELLRLVRQGYIIVSVQSGAIA